MAGVIAGLFIGGVGMVLHRRKDTAVTEFAVLRDRQFQNKDLYDLLLLGHRVIEIKWEGMKHSILVPYHRSSQYVYNMIRYRPDLYDGGQPKIEWRKHYWFRKAMTMDAYSEYEAKDGSEFKIWGGWELREEMKYHFTSIDRADAAIKFTKKKMLKAIEENNWIFASSMPKNPHFYALRRKWDSSTIEFDEFVLTIRAFGYTELYYGYPYRCLAIGDYFYWTMGGPLAITILINRKLIAK